MNLWDGNNEDEIRSTITNMTRYLFLFGVPLTVLFAGLSSQLSDLFLGSAYVAGAVVIPIVALGVFFWNAATIGQKGIEIKNRTKVLFVGVSVAVVTNVVANVPLIVAFGYVGAAVSSLISFGAYAAYIFVLSRRYIAWEIPWRSARNIVVASTVLVVPFAGLVALGQYRTGYVIAVSVVGSVAYLGAVYWFGEIGQDDVDELWGLLDRV
jgi:O-antigen/teichoic acid export membrane protein